MNQGGSLPPTTPSTKSTATPAASSKAPATTASAAPSAAPSATGASPAAGKASPAASPIGDALPDLGSGGESKVQAPPPVSDSGQVYDREHDKPVKPLAVNEGWAAVAPPSKAWSIEVPVTWKAFEGASPNELIIAAPAPGKCEFAVIPFNGNDANAMEKEIKNSETSLLGGPVMREGKKTTIQGLPAFQRRYEVNRKSGLERADVLWILSGSAQCIPIILHGPKAEVETLGATFAHACQSYKNLTGPNAAQPGGDDGKGGKNPNPNKPGPGQKGKGPQPHKPGKPGAGKAPTEAEDDEAAPAAPKAGAAAPKAGAAAPKAEVAAPAKPADPAAK